MEKPDKWMGGNTPLLIENSLHQDLITSVKKSLAFDHVYRIIKPDISPFITATATLPLKNLDDWERLIRWELSSALHNHHSVTRKINHLFMGSFTWLDLCNGDGFQRERALKSLSTEAPNGFLLALLIRRLNDWVSQVRAAACDALPVVAEKSDPEIIVDALFVTLPYWHSWGRVGEAEKRVLIKIMSLKKVVESLKNRLILSTSGPATRVFSQAGRSEILEGYLAEIARFSVQPSLRAKAYRCLLEGKFVWAEGATWQWVDKAYGIRRRIPLLNERQISTANAFIDSLKMASCDGSPMVRRVAGEMLIKHVDQIGEEAFKLAQVLAADSSASVAERGRFALKELA